MRRARADEGSGRAGEGGQCWELLGVSGGGGNVVQSYQCSSKMQTYELLLSYFPWSKEKSAVAIMT